MTTGRKPRLKGVKLDRSGTRIEPNPKRWDVSKRLKAKGKQKVKLGGKALRISKSSQQILEAAAKKRAPLMKRLAKR
jgi:hypothetical protein